MALGYLAFAGQASGAVVTAHVDVIPFDLTGPTSILQQTYPACPMCTDPARFFNGPQESLGWSAGNAGHATGTFTFDTSLGTITSTATEQKYTATGPGIVSSGS